MQPACKPLSRPWLRDCSTADRGLSMCCHMVPGDADGMPDWSCASRPCRMACMPQDACLAVSVRGSTVRCLKQVGRCPHCQAEDAERQQVLAQLLHAGHREGFETQRGCTASACSDLSGCCLAPAGAAAWHAGPPPGDTLDHIKAVPCTPRLCRDAWGRTWSLAMHKCVTNRRRL